MSANLYFRSNLPNLMPNIPRIHYVTQNRHVHLNMIISASFINIVHEQIVMCDQLTDQGRVKILMEFCCFGKTEVLLEVINSDAIFRGNIHYKN